MLITFENQPVQTTTQMADKKELALLHFKLAYLSYGSVCGKNINHLNDSLIVKEKVFSLHTVRNSGQPTN